MKCDEDGCEKRACRFNNMQWTVCRQHLEKHHPHLFDVWTDCDGRIVK